MKLVDYIFIDGVVQSGPPSEVHKEMMELMTHMKSPETGIEVRDRTYHLKTYKNCFIASDMVTWLCRYLNINRRTATRVGIHLQIKGYMNHVCKEHYVSDEHLFFKFENKPIEVVSIPDVIPTQCKYMFEIQEKNILIPSAKVSSEKSNPDTLTPYCKILVEDQIITFKPDYTKKTCIPVRNLPISCHIVVLNEEKIATNKEDLIGHKKFLFEKEGECSTDGWLVKYSSKAVGFIKVTCQCTALEAEGQQRTF
ncbi:vacuolar membrane-associated protein IML1 [Acrasis kona]|uniref:Vacuolar membrane-associated protein IML1 n=1 Tax=Acrasis kona TaxID=1008807 RepID=A0AAW2ZB08_9EUKA